MLGDGDEGYARKPSGIGLVLAALLGGVAFYFDHLANSIKVATQEHNGMSIRLEVPANQNSLQRLLKNYDTLTITRNGEAVLKVRDSDGNGSLDKEVYCDETAILSPKYRNPICLESLRKELRPKAQ